MKPSQPLAVIQPELWTLEGFTGFEVQGLRLGACACLMYLNNYQYYVGGFLIITNYSIMGPKTLS